MPRSRTTKDERMPITRQVAHYLRRYPSIRDALRRGLINHSALARLIGKELAIRKPAALLAAVQRYGRRLAQRSDGIEALDRIFEHTRYTVLSGISMAIVSGRRGRKELPALCELSASRGELLLSMEGLEHTTIVFHRSLAADVRACFGRAIRQYLDGLAVVSVKLPFKSVFTRGVSARLTGLLAEEGVVIYHEMTSAGEYFMTVAADDVSRAIAVLDPAGTAADERRGVLSID